MSTPNPKRRRFNHLTGNNSIGIHKPFRSPLRRPDTTSQQNPLLNSSSPSNPVSDSSSPLQPPVSKKQPLLAPVPSATTANVTSSTNVSRKTSFSLSQQEPPSTITSDSARAETFPGNIQPQLQSTARCSFQPTNESKTGPARSVKLRRHRPIAGASCAHVSTTINNANAHAHARNKSAALSTSPEVAALQARSLELTRQIAVVQAELDTVKQATRLMNPTNAAREVEIEALVQKWRTATRGAVEEVFAQARERVNRMGGVGAWRQREKEQRDWRRAWDEEEANEARKKAGNDALGDEYTNDDETDEPCLEIEEKEDEGKDDDSFTIGMMLKTLNIDFDIIGYDKESQRWID